MYQNDDPLDILCRKLNVAKATLAPGSPIPSTIDMRVVKDAHVPSHVLAVFDVAQGDWGPTYQPTLMPVSADMYTRDFRTNFIPQSPPGTPYPVPYWVADLGEQYVTLPVIPTLVPHAASIPLLFLFGLGFERRSQFLCCRLLPTEVIEEFPAPQAMAQLMAERCSDEQLANHIRFNQGLWKNILLLGPRDTEFIEVVHTAWNATVEARRIRQRATVTRSASTELMSPMPTRGI